jgi:hypothetical protein
MGRARLRLIGATVAVVLIAVGACLGATADGGEPGACAACGHPFRTVVVFPGNSLNVGMFLGMYDAATDCGHAPDLVIGTCGGAIPAAVIGAFPDRAERLAFAQSEEFFGFMRSGEVARSCGSELFVRALGWHCRAAGCALTPPAIFGTPVMHLPQRTPIAELNRPFPGSTHPTRVIILAGRVHEERFDQCLLGRDEKLFTETYFTDPQTAAWLSGRISAPAVRFPQSRLSRETGVEAGRTMAQAVRASISDPYIYNLADLGDARYISGALNLRPIELAGDLATEVLFPYETTGSDPIGPAAYKSVYEYSWRERERDVVRQYADYWIDFTDVKDALRDGRIQSAKLDLSCRLGLPRCKVVEADVTHREFAEKILMQYRFGYDRTVEALRLPRNDRTHIRRPDKGPLF